MRIMWRVGMCSRFRLDEDLFLTLTSRNAVDFGLPLLNNARTAELWVESLARKIPEGGLNKYDEGHIPSEVKSWAEWVGRRA